MLYVNYVYIDRMSDVILIWTICMYAEAKRVMRHDVRHVTCLFCIFLYIYLHVHVDYVCATTTPPTHHITSLIIFICIYLSIYLSLTWYICIFLSIYHRGPEEGNNYLTLLSPDTEGRLETLINTDLGHNAPTGEVRPPVVEAPPLASPMKPSANTVVVENAAPLWVDMYICMSACIYMYI